MNGPDRVVPIPSAVILVLGLTAIFVAGVVPGGTIAGPLLAILTLAFVAPWRTSPYGALIRITTIVTTILALILAGIRMGA